MTRTLAPVASVEHGRTHYGNEPLVFHCNFYNYWLQKTLLLDEGLGMDAVIRDAAAAHVFPALVAGAKATGATAPEARQKIAQDTFAELGFGTIQLAELGADGGVVHVPVSHYGRCLRQASGAEFASPQSHFDAGFAAAAAAFIHGEAWDAFAGTIEACQSMGEAAGRVRVARRESAPDFGPVANTAHTSAAPIAPYAATQVDEAGILEALSGLDFSGNEEGLLPRFGVMLTNHFASFYNRISFEFVNKMGAFGLVEAGESLLVDAGYRCAFHTFGGIMTSPEWDAVIRPQCKTQEDWVHGMVATINALGWGVWRVAEISDNRAVFHVYDDYESCGYVDMYGQADRPISHLAQAAAAGVMNLVHLGDIASKPTLDYDFYVKCFEADGLFGATQTQSQAMGAPFTEIVAER